MAEDKIEGLPDPDDVIRWNAAAAASAVNVLSDSQGLSALPPVDGLEVVGHVKPEHPEAAEPHFVRELSQPWMEGIFNIPVITLSQASSVIAGLKEANEALMGISDGKKSTRRTLWEWQLSGARTSSAFFLRASSKSACLPLAAQHWSPTHDR